MIHPFALLQHHQPPTVISPGLHKHTGRWAHTEGFVRPFIRVDRFVERRAGFEALMFHEGLHAHESHALWGLAMLCVPVLGWIAWPFWRRECEIRADAFALAAVCLDDQGKASPARVEAGLKEFRAFVLLHPHPKGRFWRWCYGRTPEHRVARAEARARRTRWDAA